MKPSYSAELDRLVHEMPSHLRSGQVRIGVMHPLGQVKAAGVAGASAAMPEPTDAEQLAAHHTMERHKQTREKVEQDAAEWLSDVEDDEDGEDGVEVAPSPPPPTPSVVTRGSKRRAEGLGVDGSSTMPKRPSPERERV
eukprot:SAG11_NODE_771_length_7253_cov_2.635741_4_plen_139_part_00